MSQLRPPRFLTLLLLACGLVGCGAGSFGPRIGGQPAPSPGPGADAPTADPAATTGGLEDEEEIHEDPDAIASLISRLSAPEPSPSPPETAPDPTLDPSEGSLAPVAYESWQLSDEECLARLTRAGVETSAPTLETPMVRTPRLLDGPIGGVTIRPRWPRSDRVNEVMDCRLVLALTELARQARRVGVREVLFYSTYRPLKAPPAECPAGRRGSSCRKAQRKYEQALKKKHSQHRRALAIDIRWLVTDDEETIDVLEHYERHSKRPPCDDEPKTAEGKLLVDFACTLHRTKVFSVMLTPNANKAHHNHFHFDITPDAKWYVIH